MDGCILMTRRKATLIMLSHYIRHTSNCVEMRTSQSEAIFRGHGLSIR